MKTYAEKLKDPRWQRRRLEIMQRDEFKCTICGSDDIQLQVHHKRYKRLSPWDHADEDLCTLCEVCHDKVTKLKNDIGWMISKKIAFDLYESVLALNGNVISAEKAIILTAILKYFAEDPDLIAPTYETLRNQLNP